MFRQSGALQKFLNMHHPMPLTAKESTQLLNLLTKSFRKHLDAASSPLSADHEVPTTIPTRLHRLASFKWKANHDSSFKPTDLHMHSILANPLFNVQQNISQDLKDPMVVFEKAASKGLLTLDAAANCLAQKRRMIIQSSVLSIGESMRQSGAGAKVLSWLMSSGIASNNSFLKHNKLANNLMDFMVAEGLEQYAWQWIVRAIESAPVGEEFGKLSQSGKHDLIKPLLLLIKAQAAQPNGLEIAIRSIHALSKHSLFKDMALNRKQRYLGAAGCYLSMEISNPDRIQPISESVFDILVSMAPQFTRMPKYHIAQLMLFHPARPNAELALMFLRKHDRSGALQNMSPEATEKHDRDVVRLGLGTANFLLETERLNDAAWVMDILQTNFSDLFDTPARAKEEESSIHLLENLSLA
ncbi:hypothetical protein BJ878DRAFT_160117 [Calycina marina]|uniref:Uncharacterized protein n=1 Tax=Calycina marina TaxID=1763456 RepID=A0A9P7Z0I3_9HELO|nr:hypothetical protein BJ878DRAFT_160117 [Calycina marina]